MKKTYTIEELRLNFSRLLSEHKKVECIQLVMAALDSSSFTIPILYEEVLAPSLNGIASNNKQQAIGIWSEHIQSGIIRTIIELCFPYLIEEQATRQENRPKALVFCQEEEYHELGARMTTDYLTLLGFDAFFIGANTPKEEVYMALEAIQPKLVCISVTNFYHLSKLNDLISNLRETEKLQPFSIAVGGYAIDHTPTAKDQISADYFTQNFEDLQAIKEAIL